MRLRALVPGLAMVFALGCGSTTPTQSAPPASSQPLPTTPSVTASPAATISAATSVPSLSPSPAGPATLRPTLEARPTPGEGNYVPLTVDASGYTPVSEYATFAAVLTNPNSEWVVYRMLVLITFLDSQEAFLAGSEIQVTVLPGQTTAIAGTTYGAGAAFEMEIQPPDDPNPYIPFVSSGTIEVTDVQSVTDASGLLTTGSLTSSLTSDQTFLQLFAVYRDLEGDIIGGATGAVDAIESGGTATFEILDTLAPPSVATTDVYWQLGGQLPQQP